MTESYGMYKRVKQLLKTLTIDPSLPVVIVDVCSGKGFTATFLSFMFPQYTIVMVDNNIKMNIT